MSAPGPAPDLGWRAFGTVFALVSAALAATLYGFILLQDPYGLRVGPGRPPRPIMSTNQRFMYPQIARSGLYDAAVFGTSTMRLLEPGRLGQALGGGRFANLAVNAATPWEQLQLARLLVRHVPALRTVVLGLDRDWCDPAADRDSHRVTFRGFPRWLYDEDPLNDWPELLNLKSLEIAGRVALHRWGALPARIRPDGFEVFTPPEASYDPARARVHLREGSGGPVDVEDAPPPPAGGPPLPAVAWLDGFAEALPATTRLVLVFPPLHALGLPAAGSRDAEADERCKARIAAGAAGRRATVVDYRWRSELNGRDDNFWDRLHYRLPVAARIVADLGAISRGAPAPADASYRVLSSPP